ncbi:jg6818 [Pararge aegeria aegeria]|uniref:Jg6818 protein n=1 Tax=Pararge aegeria aegeria TaxID=348720 RepID=A0A8S4RNX0_9NEOP|nr:jg6818 [Pararge aegeria aegeria]
MALVDAQGMVLSYVDDRFEDHRESNSNTMPLFGKSQKSPAELVRSLKDAVTALERGDKKAEKAQEDVSKNLVLIKNMLYGTSDAEPQTDIIVAQLAQELYNTNLLLLLIQELLTRHKILCAEFLEANYDKVFSHYQRLLNSENYVTRRQSLKLLGELLLDRHNFSIMTRYITNPDNLKLMMNMLKEKSRNIQFEAFHVFKVFVANPNKPKPILDILLRNQDKLVDFLTKFHTDRSEDEQFNDEKAYLIKQIKELKPLEH